MPKYNASLIDPLRGTPFFIADTYKSKWINQLYDMTVKAAAPKLWDRLIFGIEATYQNGQGAKQHDPRPLVSLSKFEIKPGVTVTLGKHAIGANYQYYSRREDGTASNKISMSTNPVYIFNFRDSTSMPPSPAARMTTSASTTPTAWASAASTRSRPKNCACSYRASTPGK